MPRGSTPRRSTLLLVELRAPVPAAARAARADPDRHPRAAVPLARRAAPTRPVVLMAHLDVVPVEGGRGSTRRSAAEIVDGSIWGRGTLDDKGCVAGICEAVETLLGRRTSCRRRTSGCRSAATRRSPGRPPRSRSPSWSAAAYGRGSCSTRAARSPRGAFPGVTAPVGVDRRHREGRDVGRAAGRGPRRARVDAGPDGPDRPASPGRSPASTSRRCPPSSRRRPSSCCRRIAPHAPRRAAAGAGPGRPAGPGADPGADRGRAGVGRDDADHVRRHHAVRRPRRSTSSPRPRPAGVNIRVMVGDTVADALAHLRKVIDDDQVHIDVVERSEPSPISPAGRGVRRCSRPTIAEVFPDAVPTPVRDDGRDRLPLLHRASATASTGSRRSG